MQPFTRSRDAHLIPYSPNPHPLFAQSVIPYSPNPYLRSAQSPPPIHPIPIPYSLNPHPLFTQPVIPHSLNPPSPKKVEAGQGRCGVSPDGADLAALARAVSEAGGVALAGVHCYNGGLQHVRDPLARRALVFQQVFSDSRHLVVRIGLIEMTS